MATGFPIIFGSGWRKNWTPAQIPTALWLDAADTATITFNGATVSQWGDKSGNIRTVSQAVAADQPTYQATGLNGKPVLSFDGSDFLQNLTPLALIRNAPGVTLVAVLSYTNNTVGRCAVSISTPTLGQNRATIGVNVGGFAGYMTGGRRLDGDSFAAAGSATFSAATTLIQVGVLDYANSDAFSYINGSLNASNTSFQTNGNSSDTDSGALYIGQSGTLTNQMIGLIGEVIVTSGALSTQDRQLLEGYLAWKWGGF